MADFKVKFKLTGLEVEIEGSHEDLPIITQNITEQFANLLAPSTAIIEGERVVSSPNPANLASPSQSATSPRKKPKRRARPTQDASGSDSTTAAITWRHDDSKFATPQQDWKAVDKYLWLLFVLEESEGVTEYTASGLVNTFNKQFRQAGALNVKNCGRDIGQLKTKNPALVGEDTSVKPSKWYLTDAGKAEARRLIAVAKGQG